MTEKTKKNNPTLVRTEAFLLKRDHEILREFAKEANIPLSKFLPSVIGIGLKSLLEEAAAAQEPSDSTQSSQVEPGAGVAGITPPLRSPYSR